MKHKEQYNTILKLTVLYCPLQHLESQVNMPGLSAKLS